MGRPIPHPHYHTALSSLILGGCACDYTVAACTCSLYAVGTATNGGPKCIVSANCGMPSGKFADLTSGWTAGLNTFTVTLSGTVTGANGCSAPVNGNMDIQIYALPAVHITPPSAQAVCGNLGAPYQFPVSFQVHAEDSSGSAHVFELTSGGAPSGVTYAFKLGGLNLAEVLPASATRKYLGAML